MLDSDIGRADGSVLVKAIMNKDQLFVSLQLFQHGWYLPSTPQRNVAKQRFLNGQSEGKK